MNRRSFEEQRKWRERWDAYYGFAMGKAEELNRLRIAELLHLASKVRELEVAESKNY